MKEIATKLNGKKDRITINRKALIQILEAIAKRGTVDMNTCVEGDLLLTAQGHFVTYDGFCDELSGVFKHKIRYSNGSLGTRCHNGMVFSKNNLPEDEDIVLIIK